jgi:hypothetical protein
MLTLDNIFRFVPPAQGIPLLRRRRPSTATRRYDQRLRPCRPKSRLLESVDKSERFS